MWTRQVTTHDGLTVAQGEIDGYVMDLAAHGNARLVITFESAGAGIDRADSLRAGWGARFLQRRGFDTLCIKPRSADWYRGAALHAFLRSPAFVELTHAYETVCLYGVSMGGYAALTFAAAVPGCTVLALSPQTTLDKRLVPEEHRFREGWHQDWDGDFADAVAGARHAAHCHVVFDPFSVPDARQARRLDAPHIRWWRVGMLGHALTQQLQQLGGLSALVEGWLTNALTPAQFKALIAPRKSTLFYLSRLAMHRGSLPLAQHCLAKAQALHQSVPALKAEDRHLRQLTTWVLVQEGRFAEMLAQTAAWPGEPDPWVCEVLQQRAEPGMLKRYLCRCLAWRAPVRQKQLPIALRAAIRLGCQPAVFTLLRALAQDQPEEAERIQRNLRQRRSSSIASP